MFGRLPLYVIQFPSKRFGYVGSIPTDLGTEIAATREAVMGCRVHRTADGSLVEWEFPTFNTQEAALDFARSKGFNPSV